MQFPGSPVKACSGESKELEFFDISRCTEFLTPPELPKYVSRAVLVAVIKVLEFPVKPSACDNILPLCLCSQGIAARGQDSAEFSHSHSL